MSYEGSEEAQDILEKAEQNVFAIAQKRSTKTYSLIHDVLKDAFDSNHIDVDEKEIDKMIE